MLFCRTEAISAKIVRWGKKGGEGREASTKLAGPKVEEEEEEEEEGKRGKDASR